MNEDSPLFRSAALEARRTSTTGEIILTRSVPLALLTLLAAVAGGAIVGFFAWGSYTRHTTLAGRLVPDVGVVRVHAPQHGTIVEKNVSEGERLERGDVLYVVSSERSSSTLGATQALIGVEVGKKLQSLREQIEKLRRLERTERESLERIAAALRSEAAQLSEMKASQRRRVELAEQAAARYERLRERGFVSGEHSIAKQEAVLEQRSRLRQLERESSDLARRSAELRGRLLELPLRYQNRAAEIERAIAGARQELTENEASRRIAVTAPAAGIATAAQADVGRFVDPGDTLVSIVPRGAALRAVLYAPSRAVGFLDVGDRVLLRYEAYAYQKFGHYGGRITAISRAAVPAPAAGDAAGRGRSVYEVTVALGSQAVTAYGETRPLRAGMTVHADVLQEERRLYEWVLEPLYTLTGRWH